MVQFVSRLGVSIDNDIKNGRAGFAFSAAESHRLKLGIKNKFLIYNYMQIDISGVNKVKPLSRQLTRQIFIAHNLYNLKWGK